VIVLVPSTIVLLPLYAGVEDPVAPLRAACLAATASLVADGPSAVDVICAPARADNVQRGVLEPAGMRIARHLLGEAGWSGEVVEGAGAPLLVVANGSATRSEKAPGHLDPRSSSFDEGLENALRSGDVEALAALDAALASELWCNDAAAFHALASVLPAGTRGEVSYADDPYGVQYWVVTWR
jgi:hypothetical protein